MYPGCRLPNIAVEEVNVIFDEVNEADDDSNVVIEEVNVILDEVNEADDDSNVVIDEVNEVIEVPDEPITTNYEVFIQKQVGRAWDGREIGLFALPCVKPRG